MSLRSSSLHALRIHALRSDANRAVIHYFEKYESGIRMLDPEEYFEVLLVYLDALFACGEYATYTDRVEEALLLAIDIQLQTVNEEDIFHHLLFRKAAAQYNLGKLPECNHVLSQLIGIAPGHKLAMRFLVRSISATMQRARQQFRALSIALFLTSVLIIATEILWVRPFQPEWTARIEMVRNSVFVLGLLVLAGGELYIWLRARRSVQQVHLSAIRRRRREHQTEMPCP